MCTKPTIVANPADCPVLRVPRKDPIAKREIVAPLLTGVWTEWKPWSKCVASACAEVGIKERERECIFKEGVENIGQPLCVGAKRQRSICMYEC